jgi:biotin operon repressor
MSLLTGVFSRLLVTFLHFYTLYSRVFYFLFMDFYNHKKQQIERILYLAERESTGNLSELSSRLEVSERTVKRIVQYLRDEGIPIVFCRKTNSYKLPEYKVYPPLKYRTRIKIKSFI